MDFAAVRIPRNTVAVPLLVALLMFDCIPALGADKYGMKSKCIFGLNLMQVSVVGINALQLQPAQRKFIKVELNETGYQQAVALKSDSIMAQYMRKLVSHFGGRVIDDATLRGVVPFYSGTQTSQSYQALVRELADVPWVDWSNVTANFARRIALIRAEKTESRRVRLAELAECARAPGAVASLSESGYAEVAELRNDPQMEIFIRRVISSHGGRIIAEDDLRGLVSFYSGRLAKQTLNALNAELQRVPWVADYSDSVDLDQTFSSTAPLDDDGFKAVRHTRRPEDVEMFARRMVAAYDASIVDVDAFKQFIATSVKQIKSYDKFLAKLRAARWILNFPHLDLSDPANAKVLASRASSGGSIELNQTEFDTIVRTHKYGETLNYVKRLLAKYGARISDPVLFSRFVGRYVKDAAAAAVAANGTDQGERGSLRSLLAALDRVSFVAWSS
eukprot:TRINITY_DN39394_c0_g1_i1.p1 TRINITY_DN39394_c0_g1~~TRINITY_DN39394_c0_g1_i1.p1  ORF type:complete len:477 (-),score=85.43 TRINITY_DN39394_c0_g1_i1:69-1412(-)